METSVGNSEENPQQINAGWFYSMKVSLSMSLSLLVQKNVKRSVSMQAFAKLATAQVRNLGSRSRERYRWSMSF